jgi:hypothetical protein
MVDRTVVAVVAVRASGDDTADLTRAVSAVTTALGCDGADVLAATSRHPTARMVAWAMTRDLRAWMTIASRGEPMMTLDAARSLARIMGSSRVSWWSVSVTWRGPTRDVSPMVGDGVLIYSWSAPQPANPTDPRTMSDAIATARDMADGADIASRYAAVIPHLEAARSVVDAAGGLVASLPDIATVVSGGIRFAPLIALGALLIFARKLWAR